MNDRVSMATVKEAFGAEEEARTTGSAPRRPAGLGPRWWSGQSNPGRASNDSFTPGRQLR